MYIKGLILEGKRYAVSATIPVSPIKISICNIDILVETDQLEKKKLRRKA